MNRFRVLALSSATPAPQGFFFFRARVLVDVDGRLP
jgi:hypothetical protein